MLSSKNGLFYLPELDGRLSTLVNHDINKISISGQRKLKKAVAVRGTDAVGNGAQVISGSNGTGGPPILPNENQNNFKHQ